MNSSYFDFPNIGQIPASNRSDESTASGLRSRKQRPPSCIFCLINRSFSRLGLLGSLLVIAGILQQPGLMRGQDSGPKSSTKIDDGSDSARNKLAIPQMFGFNLPPGEPRWANRKVNAYIRTPDGHAIGRVHVKVGENYIVVMPDGSLEARKSEDVKFTDKPVKWATAEELVAQTRSGKLKNFKTLIRNDHVFVYNTSEQMAEVTARVMDSMTRGVIRYMEGLGLKPHQPVVPMVVIMFKTQAEFQAYKRMPPGIVAYYNVITNRVYLYEESPLLRISRDLAIRETLSTIAHEGAHQILANIGVQQRLSMWPMWATEGMAEFLAPTSVTRGMRWKGAGQINDFRMLELETHLRSEAIDGIDGQTLKDTVAAARLTSTGYASAWSLTNFLAKRHRSEFKEFIQSVSKLRPFEGAFPSRPDQARIPENIGQFEAFFKDDWKGLETDMIKYLTRQKFESPFSEFVHYAVLIEIPDEKRKRPEKHSAVFHTQRLAERWANEFARKKSNGTTKPLIRILRCPNRPEAVKQTKLFYSGR